MSAPQPLTGPDCDLRDFAFMPLDVNRLLTSETWIEAADDPKLGHALVCLWCAAWHQLPAGSLPDNDRVLARFAMCTADEWERLRDRALEGWQRCSDGRLYHPVVAEKALEAWIEKLGQRKSSAAGNAKRWGVEITTSDVDRRIEIARAMLAGLNPESRTLRKRLPKPGNGNPEPIPLGVPLGSQETGTGTETETGTETGNSRCGAHAPAAVSDEDRFWSRIDALGDKGISRSRCMQVLKLTGNDFLEANHLLDSSEGADNPAKYLGGIIRRLEAGETVTPPGMNPNVPPWVNERRSAGIRVERDGHRWRSQGDILNDAGEVIGF